MKNAETTSRSTHLECAGLCRMYAVELEKRGAHAAAARSRAGALHHERMAKLASLGKLVN